MPYLIQNDFKKQIQLANMQQVIGSDYSIINSWLLAAQEKATSYLVQKYFTALEFTPTNIWDGTKAYNAADRVYLDAPAFDPTLAYAIGANCTYQGNFYIAIAAITAGVFNPANWSAPIPQYAIYYAAFPYPMFNVYGNYNTGDQVTWMNLVYTATQPTACTNDSYVLQYGTINNIPLTNYFPGSPQQNQWNAGVAYSVPEGTSITDTDYWTQGDNRSQQMVQTCINMVLYYAHSRISPMNIPNHIKDNYREAVNWLKDASDGIITPLLQKVQPNQGNRIRYGGNIRNQNSY